MEPDHNEDGTLDIDSAVSGIADDLFGRGEPEVPAELETAPPETAEVPVVAEEVVPEVPVRQPPKSWAKDKHEVWTKMAPEAQEYYETREKQMLDGLEQYKGDAGLGKQMRDVITPYQHIIAAQGLDAPKAVQTLLNAHYKLSSGSPQERAAYFKQVAQSYGIDIGGIQGEQPQIDPQVKAVQDQVQQLQASLMQSQQTRYNEARTQVEQQVNAFASDPKNVYFDEVADDIVSQIHAGASLQDAYDKAVWANPVTRQKELDRAQAEREKALRGKSKQEAEKALKAKSSNVRSRDTTRTPTEALGKMDDTMRATLAEIKSRTH